MSKKWTDWIPHEGDECPVDRNEFLRVKFSDGYVLKKTIASAWNWGREESLPITHYKRLRKNVEAEKLDAEIDAFMEDDPEAERGTSGDRLIRSATQAREIAQAAIADDLSTLERDIHESGRHDPEPSEATPAPIITGPGEYVTAGGDKVTVLGKSTSIPGTFGGVISSQDGHVFFWFEDGGLFPNTPCPRDITGPWQEPEKAETKPERWANLYEASDDRLYLFDAEYFTKEEAIQNQGFGCIGAVLLNPEEE